MGTFQSKDAAHGRTGARGRSSHNVIQWLHHLESKFVDLRVCSVNVGNVRGRSGDIVEMLKCTSVDFSCVQDTACRR